MIVDGLELVSAVRALAAENPDKVYESPDEGCYYIHETDCGLVGGCIVGQAAIKVGVPVEVLRGFDKRGDHAGVAHTFTEFQLSASVLSWLTFVQESQDHGVPWGEAVAGADRNWGDLIG